MRYFDFVFAMKFYFDFFTLPCASYGDRFDRLTWTARGRCFHMCGYWCFSIIQLDERARSKIKYVLYSICRWN